MFIFFCNDMFQLARVNVKQYDDACVFYLVMSKDACVFCFLDLYVVEARGRTCLLPWFLWNLWGEKWTIWKTIYFCWRIRKGRGFVIKLITYLTLKASEMQIFVWFFTWMCFECPSNQTLFEFCFSQIDTCTLVQFVWH